MIIVKDLSKPESASEIYDEVKATGVEVDYLINNAGFGGRGKFHEREWEQDLAMINLNVIALTTLTRLFLPDFVKKNRGKNFKCIINSFINAWTITSRLLCH